MQATPTLSRQATPNTKKRDSPGYSNQYKSAFSGVVNEAKLGDHLKNVTSLSVMHVDFTNPFITITRYVTKTRFRCAAILNWMAARKPTAWKIDAGVEWQRTNATINNYDNNLGVQGNPQKLDKINTDQHFVFGRYSADIFTKLAFRGCPELNYYDYDFKNTFR